MKKALLIVLALVVIVIGAVIAVPFVVPTETYTRQLEAQVEQATGRTLTIEGPVELSILPRLALDVQNVHFANPPGGLEPDMATLDALEVRLKLLPLLTGTVEVDRFVLIEPEIHLEVDAEGRPNWQFAEAAPEEPGTATGEGDGGLPITELKLGDIRIENGTVTYTDAATGTAERVENVAMAVRLPDMRGPFEAEGSFVYQGEAVTLDLVVATPLALIEQGASAVTTAVTAPELELRFDGEVRGGPAPDATGQIDLAVTSIRELVAWLGEPLDFEGEGLQTLEISGRLEAAPERVAFADATIGLDQVSGQGQVAVDLRAAAPKVSGRLDLGAVDLNPYLPPETEEEAPADADPAGPESGPPDWSDEPIALPPVGGFGLDFEFTTEGLTYRELEIGPAVLALRLADDVFTADLTDFTLYGGRGRGTLEVALAEEGVPEIRKQFRLDGLQALPFLTAVADFERLEGTLSAELAVETRGRTERELVQNLNGDGQATFTDGAIVGINIAAMVRNVGSAFLDPTAQETRRTDFAELAGSFTIEDGILRNDDMRLQAPVLRVEGRGRVDLPERTIDYRVEPKAAPTLEGQGGTQDLAGILVPVQIQGPWHDLSFRPDLSAVLETALESPEALGQQVEQLERVIEENREQLGGQADELRQRLEQARETGDVEGLVEGLTGVLRGSGQPNQGEEAGGEAAGGEEAGGDAAGQPAEEPAQQLLRQLFRN